MIVEGRCSQSDLLETDCAHCRNAHKTITRRKQSTFWSSCPGCDGEIHPGEVIGHVEGTWVCQACTREARETPR